MIDVEAVIDKLTAVAIVDLGPITSVRRTCLPRISGNDSGSRHWPWLPIDDDEIATAVLAGPRKSDKVIRGPVAGPGRLWLDLRPRAVAKGSLLQYRQQNDIKRSDLRVRRIERAATEMSRHSDPGALLWPS